MRKILSFSFMALALSVLSTGCLKDKGYEDQKYGIQIADIKGVAFPQAKASPVIMGVDSRASAFTVDGPVIALEQEGVASSAVTVTLATNDALVTDAGITPLPSGAITLPSSMNIASGTKLSGAIPLTLTNTSLLDPNITYGVGISIASVTGGYTIAQNQKNIVIGFNIKNKYDGKYRLRGYHNRPGLSNPYDEEVDMITSGPTSVTMFWPALGDYAHPLNGGVTYYGTFTANFIFNASDQMTGWDWTPFPTTLPTALDGAVSRYDASTKTIYFHGWYNNNPGARKFFDTLTYIGPR